MLIKDFAKKFAKKIDLVSFESVVYVLDIDKLKTVPVYLSKLRNVVKSDVVKKLFLIN